MRRAVEEMMDALRVFVDACDESCSDGGLFQTEEVYLIDKATL